MKSTEKKHCILDKNKKAGKFVILDVSSFWWFSWGILIVCFGTPGRANFYIRRGYAESKTDCTDDGCGDGETRSNILDVSPLKQE